MNTYEQLGRALELAVVAHSGQLRRNGWAYAYHPLRLMMRCRELNDMIVAILHDVVEDTEYGLGDVKRIVELNEELTHDLDCLTRRHDEYYIEYIKRLKDSLRAVKIKKIDIEDNLPTAKEKRKKLYEKALIILNH